MPDPPHRAPVDFVRYLSDSYFIITLNEKIVYIHLTGIKKRAAVLSAFNKKEFSTRHLLLLYIRVQKNVCILIDKWSSYQTG